MDAKLELPMDLSLEDLVHYSQEQALQVQIKQVELEREIAHERAMDELAVQTSFAEMLPLILRKYLWVEKLDYHGSRGYDYLAEMEAPGLAPIKFYLQSLTRWDQERNTTEVTGARLPIRPPYMSVVRYVPRKEEDGWYRGYELEDFDTLSLALARAAEIGDIREQVEAEVAELQAEWESEKTAPIIHNPVKDYLKEAVENIELENFEAAQAFALMGIGEALVRLEVSIGYGMAARQDD